MRIMILQQFARQLRVPTSPITRWCRYNTNGNVIPSLPAYTSKPSASNDAQLKQSSSSRSNSVDSGLSAPSLDNDLTGGYLKSEMSEVSLEDLEAALKRPPPIATTEAEMFGEQPVQDVVRHVLDPESLPTSRLNHNPGITEEEEAASIIHGRGVHFPKFHPRTHDIPVANIQFRSHHPELLELFTHFATHAASSLRIPISRVVYLPTQRTLWTVLRSPFAHKKKQENFERKVHKRAIKAWDADPEVVDRWCRYLRRHALGGVGMRVTRWERMPLGVGKTMLAGFETPLEQTEVVTGQKIKALGQKIVAEELKVIRKANA